MTKYNKWSELEDALLLNYVIAGLEMGSKIVDLVATFSNTYGVTKDSVSNRWQQIAKMNELYVASAKLTWKLWGKPAQEEKVKASKAEVVRLTTLNKAIEKSRVKWLKQKTKQDAKKTKDISFATPAIPNPSTRNTYIVDAQGLLIQVKTAVNQ
jgi:hypothetical protein